MDFTTAFAVWTGGRYPWRRWLALLVVALALPASPSLLRRHAIPGQWRPERRVAAGCSRRRGGKDAPGVGRPISEVSSERSADLRIRLADISASPSGKLATVTTDFQFRDENLPHRSVLWLFDLYRGKKRLLVDGPLMYFHRDWTNGDRAVLFTGDDARYSRDKHIALPLRVIDPLNGMVRTLCEPAANSYISGASWSPNGRWIAFNRRPFPRKDTAKPGAWLISQDGTTQKRVAPPGGAGICWCLGWTPDGSNRFYLYTPPEGLWIMDPEGHSY
ncbi:MAG TPA: hypothetical protein VFJ58_26255, partial [Armatimonadota bacterium]|nr:hypothetical protein [Armatimonadota bacterium]